MNSRYSRALRVALTSAMALSGGRSLRAQVEYTADGIPKPWEEEVRWEVNRARFDRAGENQARGTSFTDIPESCGPLAPANSLTLAARHHSEDMARKNVFQSQTVTGSAFYDPATQSEPVQRMQAEGYGGYSAWAENVTAGPATAELTCVSGWNSTNYRRNAGNPAFLEIGTGYFYLSSADHNHYWTTDLIAGSSSFVTDTVFFDGNGDSKYTQGEGVEGVRVSLRMSGTEHTDYDISAGPGNFAVPLDGIPIGQPVEVWLTNQKPVAVTLSIPRDYRMLEALSLAPGQSHRLGIFSRPAFGVNLGFRSLTNPPLPVTAPVLTLTKTGNTVEIAWSSQTDLQYLAQWSPDLSVWMDFGGGYKEGTGGVMSQTDAATMPKKYYRLVVKKS